VKFDFLGLRTLTIIDWALAIINRRLAAEAPADRHHRDPARRPRRLRAAHARRDHRGVQLECAA